MTADSLKAFITLPTTTTIYKKQDASHQRAKLFCFSLFLAAFCVTVSCYQIWNFLRTNELRTEVDMLKDKVENMRKRMGLELFDDLNEFGNVYDEQHPHEEFENDVFSDDLSDFDEDLEDEEYDEVYDLDADLDPHPNDDEDETEDGVPEVGSGLLNTDDYDMIRESSTGQRKPRAVTVPEVPVIEESYALRRNKTHATSDDHLSKMLLKKSVSPKLYYDWAQKSNGGGGAPVATDRTSGEGHHQAPRRHMKKFLAHRGPPTLYVTRPASSAADDNNGQLPQIHIRHNNHHSQQQLRTHQNRELRHKFQQEVWKDKEEKEEEEYEPGRGINNVRRPINPPEAVVHVRASRVMATNEDKSKAFRQTITKREYARLRAMQTSNQFVESKAHPEMIAYPPSAAAATPSTTSRRMVRKSGSSGSGKVARQVSSRPRLIAVQFNGDTSRYATEHHEHYHGNGLLRHAGGVYQDWTEAPWVTSMGMDKHFHMQQGVVTVREPGLYYIYAQIYYKDEHDTNGFVIEQNNNSIMQCSTMTHTTHRVSKTKTCHTAGVAFLRADDRLQVLDLGHQRLVILEAGKSFFGLVKLAGFHQQQHLQRQQLSPQGLTDSPTVEPNFF